jgi:hypothetical protein
MMKSLFEIPPPPVSTETEAPLPTKEMPGMFGPPPPLQLDALKRYHGFEVATKLLSPANFHEHETIQ